MILKMVSSSIHVLMQDDVVKFDFREISPKRRGKFPRDHIFTKKSSCCRLLFTSAYTEVLIPTLAPDIHFNTTIDYIRKPNKS